MLSFVVSRCWLADPRENSVSHWCANRRTLFPDSSKPRNEREQLESRATSFDEIDMEGKDDYHKRLHDGVKDQPEHAVRKRVKSERVARGTARIGSDRSRNDEFSTAGETYPERSRRDHSPEGGTASTEAANICAEPTTSGTELDEVPRPNDGSAGRSEDTTQSFTNEVLLSMRLHCQHCGDTRHRTNDCRRKTSTRVKFHALCHNCGTRGHYDSPSKTNQDYESSVNRAHYESNANRDRPAVNT